MIQTAPVDPGMRKVMLPSIIRISDAWKKSAVNRSIKSHRLRSRHLMNRGLIQLELELGS